jgi:hypothetical protein
VWAYRGAVIGLLLGIGWNTSAATAVLEGGHHHLSFGGIVLCGIGGGVVGLIIGASSAGSRAGRDVFRP